MEILKICVICIICAILAKVITPTNHEIAALMSIAAVIVCAFYIVDAIRHILGQSFHDFELLIIDDGSTDGTEALIKEKYPSEIKSGKIVYYKIQ